MLSCDVLFTWCNAERRNYLEASACDFDACEVAFCILPNRSEELVAHTSHNIKTVGSDYSSVWKEAFLQINAELALRIFKEHYSW